MFCPSVGILLWIFSENIISATGKNVWWHHLSNLGTELFTWAIMNYGNEWIMRMMVTFVIFCLKYCWFLIFCWIQLRKILSSLFLKLSITYSNLINSIFVNRIETFFSLPKPSRICKLFWALLFSFYGMVVHIYAIAFVK